MKKQKLKKSALKLLRPFKAIALFVAVDMKKVMKNFARHDGELSTCALAFFLLISFIPASLVIISILSFFYDSEDMASFYLTNIKYQLPSINIEDISSIFDKIVYSKRYLAFIWLPFLFWWGSFVFDIIERGLEKAFKIKESRKYWKAKIRHFIIIIGIGFFVLFLTLASNLIAVAKNSDIVNYANQNLGNIPILKSYLLKIGHIPLILSSAMTLLINSVLIFLLYKFVPPAKLKNRSLFKGALFASLSYEVVKWLFSYYITEINDYSSIFGSLNTVVILMIWIWYTCFLFVIGAEMAWVMDEKKTAAALKASEKNNAAETGK
ncbi:MAG: YihY/virulence factor BrkB family protein [Spirochaetes bacterium]|jgi:membrane protein|nr:YihY/virulence factor BrkB family protein [Spirochaetota bacterium]